MRSLKHLYRAAFLAALLLLCLCGCGEPDPNAGVYRCAEVTVGEEALPPSALYNGEVGIELRSGGGGRLTLGENAGDLRWSLEEEKLTLDFNGRRCPGTLSDGCIRVKLPDEDVWLTLYREDVFAQRPTPTPQPALLSLWTGDWYGWWEIENSQGAMPDTWYDCCASVVLTGDGLVLTLWDERSSRMEPMGVLNWVSDGESLTVTGGWFWYDAVEEGQWSLTPSADRIELSGRHEGEGESFDYRIVLRPWGADWEDTEERPYSYRFWYLPLVEAGESMPDKITTEAPLP